MKHSIFLLSLFLFIACGKKDDAPGTAGGGVDSTEANNKAKFREVYAIFQSGDLAKLDQYIAADYTEHTPWPGQEPGLAGMKKGFTEFKAAFPDLTFSLTDVWADGDIVIGHFTQTGTMTGALGPMPATNKKMEIRGVDIVRIKDGKATEHWGYSEENKMAQQMGWAPSMDAMTPPDGTGGKGGTTGGTPKSNPPTGTPKGTPKQPPAGGTPKY